MAFNDNIENYYYEKNLTIEHHQPSIKWLSAVTNITNAVLKGTYITFENISNSYNNMNSNYGGSNNTSSSRYVNATSSNNINNSTEVPYEEYKYRPETYMVPIMFSIIFIVGVVGNGTLIIVFVRHRAMRNVPNT